MNFFSRLKHLLPGPAVIAGALLILIFTGQTLGQDQSKKVLRIALPDEASLAHHSAGKFEQIVNLMQEYWQVWSIDHQQPVQFIRIPSARSLEALRNNEIDIVAISVAREYPDILFSIPYAKFHQRIYRRLNAKDTNRIDMAIHSPTQNMLASMTPYVRKSYYTEIDALLNDYQQYNAIYSVQPWELERKLKARGLEDIFYVSEQETPDIAFRFAFRADDEALALEVNDYLREISTLQAQLWTDKYIIKNDNRFVLSLGQYDKTLSDKEKRFVLHHPHLRFPSMPEGFAPYMITNSFNHVGATGFTIDLLSRFSEKLGVTFEPVYVGSIELGDQAINAGDLDFYHLRMNDDKSSRHLMFSHAYVYSNFSLITRDGYILNNHITSLTDEHIGVIKGFIGHDELRERLPEARFSYFQSLQEAFDALDSGVINALVEPTLSSSYFIKQHGFARLTSQPLHGFLKEVPLSFAALQSNSELIVLLNRALSSIDTAEYDEMYTRWNAVAFSEGDMYAQVSNIYQKAGYILLTIFFMSVLMTVFYFHQIRLRKAAQNEAEAALVVAEKARAAAEQSGIAKTSFLARMSHEIRTPMNGVFGMAEALRYTQLDKHQTELLNTLTSSADNLLSILNDVLDFSKMDAGKLTLESVPIEIATLTNNVINAFTPLAQQKGLRLKLNIDEQLSQQYLLDPTRLTQVLNNLVSNALKFTEFGQVEVQLKLAKRDCVEGVQYDSIYFAVIDSGIGIAKEQQNLLFSPFSQADSAVTRRFGGTGLGLSICQEIVNAMGGQIAIDSQEGEGSCFHFTVAMKSLVVETPEPTAIETPEIDEQASLPDFSTLSVLLVEDNIVNIKVLTAQLERLRIHPDLAYNGEEALKMHHEHEYDLIISDCHMPILDGFELANILSKQPKSKPFWMIAVTADALADTADKCIDAGFNDYMTKPCPQDEITQKMVNAYQQLQSQKARYLMPKQGGQSDINTDADTQYFQPNRLLQRNQQDKVLTKRVCELFVETWPTEKQQIHYEMTRENFVQLEAVVHKLKGSLRYLAVDDLEDKIVSFEALCSTQNGTQIEQELTSLVEAVDQISEEINQWLNHTSNV